MKNNRENDRWLEDQFKSIPVAERVPCMRQYSFVYREAGDNEAVSYAKTVEASRAANIWLRERVKNGNIRKPRI